MTSERTIRRLLPVLFEDDQLLVIAKPAGVDTGGLPKQTWPGLMEILPRIREGESLFAANRLSRYESGILILAKKEPAVQTIRQAIRSMRVSQDYFAVVLGRMQRPRMTIGSEHGSSTGRSVSPRRRVPTRRNQAPGVAVKRGGSEGMVDAKSTTLTVLRAGEKRTLLRIRTAVPTTHALRAQLRSVRLRVLGDLVRPSTHRPMRHDMTCLHLGKVAFEHPATKRPVSIENPPPTSFFEVLGGRSDTVRPLAAATVRRLPLLVTGESDAWRLVHGDVEDVPGIIADKFGDVIVLQVLRERAGSSVALKQIARWFRETLSVRSVYARRNFRTGEGDAPQGLKGSGPELLLGPEAAEEFEIVENQMRFLVRPMSDSVGLFLDHRDNRVRIRENAKGRDVLNLFAYTCGFSLAAALGGARSTVSVDLSPQHLNWGGMNFQLNDVADHRQEFVQAEAFEFLSDARDSGRTFDIVILDPPTFAHGRKRGRDFSIRRDLADLVRAAAAVLRPDGVMMISTNLRSFSLPTIKEQIRRGASSRKFEIIDVPELPIDFVVDPDHAKTLFLRFS